jgi:hypothetical protein
MAQIGLMIYTHLIYKLFNGKRRKPMEQNQHQDADIPLIILMGSYLFLEEMTVT